MAADAVFLDTCVLVPASVHAHPAHQAASQFVASLVAQSTPLCISPQVCREFLVVLTRQPVSGRTFKVDEALAALEQWRSACSLLEEDELSVNECLDLVRRHGVRGKQVHDCNIVAVMRTHAVSRLATRNPDDFKRYPGLRIETP